MSNLQQNEDYREIGGRLWIFSGILGLSQEQIIGKGTWPVKLFKYIKKS